MIASTCPAFTWAPTVVSTAVSVPLVAKPTDAVSATPTFPDALTLAWTIPRVTIAVRWPAELEEEEPLKKL